MRPREYPSRNSPSIRYANEGRSTPLELAGLDNILKSHYLGPIREQLHALNPLMSEFWTSSYSLDWGFDEVWPSAVDQPWFKTWIRDYELEERKKKPPFIRAFEDEVDYLSLDLHRDIHRQFVGKTAEIPVEREK